MQVQIVRGATRHRALQEARRQYGPDPLVLSVRECRTPQGQSWEALVARETPSAPDEDPTVEALPVLSDALLAAAAQPPAEPNIPAPELPPLRAVPAPPPADDLVIEAPVEHVSAPRSAPQTLATMRADLAAIVANAANPGRGSLQEVLDFARRLTKLEEDVCATMLSTAEVKRAWMPFLDRLDKSGFPKAEAVEVLRAIDREPAVGAELTDWTHYYRRLRRVLAASVEVAPTEERLNPGLVVFVGGAGVGKTTLAAKLAADLSLGGARPPVLGAILPRRGVGLAALKRCATTLGIEFCEVQTRQDLAELERRATEGPVVLDTASVNPFDGAALGRLEAVLACVKTKEIHTVVPACHSSRDFAHALSAFSTVGANRLAVTRLDEAPFVGRVIAAAKNSRMPISYLSQGPRIPDDLVRPGVDSLLDAVLRPERISAS